MRIKHVTAWALVSGLLTGADAVAEFVTPPDAAAATFNLQLDNQGAPQGATTYFINSFWFSASDELRKSWAEHEFMHLLGFGGTALWDSHIDKNGFFYASSSQTGSPIAKVLSNDHTHLDPGYTSTVYGSQKLDLMVPNMSSPFLVSTQDVQMVNDVYKYTDRFNDFSASLKQISVHNPQYNSIPFFSSEITILQSAADDDLLALKATAIHRTVRTFSWNVALVEVVPEPPSFMLLGFGLFIVLIALVWQQRKTERFSFYCGSPLGCAQATGLEPAQDVLRAGAAKT